MPRKPRMYLPGVPAHVVQRGNNREPCFFAEADYEVYKSALADALERYDVRLHAYALMTNHVHLLMTPQTEDGISRVLQHVGRLYVRHINDSYRRTGTLWEGRHKASLIDADDYLFICYRYIELNPVRAGMVAAPDHYPWSSYARNAWGADDGMIIDHDLYAALGADLGARGAVYRELFRGLVADEYLSQINEALSFNHPLGNDRFKEKIAMQLGRSIGQARCGRPSTSVSTDQK